VSVYARIAVTAEMTAHVAAQTRTLVVTAAYARASAPTVPLRLDSTAVIVTAGGGTDVPVQINLTACLADPMREAAAVPVASAGTAAVCQLHLGLALLDGSGVVIARAQVVVPASAGATVAAPPVTFVADAGLGPARWPTRGPHLQRLPA
jgi:hypothetical protein